MHTIIDTTWLSRRFELFDHFCFPSVCHQTTSAFKWLVFFDVRTPQAFRERAHSYAHSGVLVPLFVDNLAPATVRAAIAAHTRDQPTHLITTRLDNDDAICREFVARVQREFHEQPFEFINFTHGYIWHRGRVYLHRDHSNAFASLIELSHEYRTVWCRQHPDLAQVGPLRQVSAPPAWLQVVHDTNLSNRIRGIRQRPGVLGDRFALALEVHETSNGATLFLLDKYGLGAVRLLRETAIHSCKRLIRICRSRAR